MNPAVWQTRLLVPRWRSLAGTLRSGELGSFPKAAPSAQSGNVLLARLESWHLTPDLIRAAEVVETALMAAREQDGVDAALQLLEQEATPTPLIRQQAAALLMRAGRADEIPPEYRENNWTRAVDCRETIRAHPGNPLAWVELGLRQVVSGHPNAALRSIAVALQLSPNNRHVLRSAARLFLHVGEKDRAHALIMRNSATPNDPWLLAAEIALAQVVEKNAKFTKQAFAILSADVDPRQITELAGAVGTKELKNGSVKKAKRLFAQSMIDPTGSSLAQGEWAVPILGAELIDPRRFGSVEESFEASALHLYREFRFNEVSPACEAWAEVDPFSIRPFELGSAAAGHAGDFETAAKMAAKGLRLRPRSPLLLNCKAFALASMGRPEDAVQTLAEVDAASVSDQLKYLTKANKGLSAFRLGQNDEALAHYLDAIEGFRKIGNLVSSAHARVYLAQEAVRAGLSNAPELLKQAQNAMRPFKNSEAMVVLRRLEQSLAIDQSSAPTHLAPEDAPSAIKPTPLPHTDLSSIKWITPGWPRLPK